jgi:hypothetical protein
MSKKPRLGRDPFKDEGPLSFIGDTRGGPVPGGPLDQTRARAPMIIGQYPIIPHDVVDPRTYHGA